MHNRAWNVILVQIGYCSLVQHRGGWELPDASSARLANQHHPEDVQPKALHPDDLQ